MRFLITSDNHLGYKENDPVLGLDSFVAFEEVLRIAQERNVDFLLQGGDLFHENIPTKDCLSKAFKLLTAYCIGNRPITFSSSISLNCDSENINISLPIIAIHGNHDDPCGRAQESILETIQPTMLLNYIGKHESIDRLCIEPVLIHKNGVSVAIYGVGNVRDTRMYQLFMQNKITFKRPSDFEQHIHVLVLHQNRVAYSGNDYVPIDRIPAWFDLVIFGHEHEPLLYHMEAKDFTILQCGSTVRTSLCAGEAGDKFAYIIDIGETIDIEKVRLMTVRPFIMDDLEITPDIENPDSFIVNHLDKLVKKVNAAYSTQKAISQAHTDDWIYKSYDTNHSIFSQKSKPNHNPADYHDDLFQEYPSILPLVRLRIQHENAVISRQKIVNSFSKKVANPNDMLKIRQKTRKKVKIEEVSSQSLKRDVDFADMLFKNPTLCCLPESLFIQAVRTCLRSGKKTVFDELTDEIVSRYSENLSESVITQSMIQESILALKNQINKDNNYTQQ